MPSLLSSMYFLGLCQFDMTRNRETKSILHLIWVVGKGRLAKADITFAPPLVDLSRGNILVENLRPMLNRCQDTRRWYLGVYSLARRQSIWC